MRVCNQKPATQLAVGKRRQLPPRSSSIASCGLRSNRECSHAGVDAAVQRVGGLSPHRRVACSASQFDVDAPKSEEPRLELGPRDDEVSSRTVWPARSIRSFTRRQVLLDCHAPMATTLPAGAARGPGGRHLTGGRGHGRGCEAGQHALPGAHICSAWQRVQHAPVQRLPHLRRL